MAERIQVELVDDIDGSKAQHTVTFALDGVTYEIDLNDRHAQQLRSVFAHYIDRAQKPAPATSGSTRQQEREERRNRQANRQLTEQIRGAAQRTRDRFKEQEETPQKPDSDSETSQGPVNAESIGTEPPAAPPVNDQPKPDGDESEDADLRVPAVSLPQFSSAVE